jgi:hypothetical protein
MFEVLINITVEVGAVIFRFLPKFVHRKINPDSTLGQALGLLLGISLVIAVVVLAGCKHDSKLDKRVVYWENTLNHDLPVGTNADEIKKWGASHNIKFDHLKTQQWLYANVEIVPETGITFPCSAWNIIIKITIDDKNKSVKNNISTVGSCI